MEQVPSKHVIAIVERVRKEHVGSFEYGVFDLERLGVPQTRKRLVAGSPLLIAQLTRAHETATRRSVRDVISCPRATHIRNSKSWTSSTLRASRVPGVAKYSYKKASWNDFCKPVSGPAPTVVGGHALVWVLPSGKAGWRSVLTPRELATLQTFPGSYKLPENKTRAYREIGNAVPPAVARLIMSNPTGS
jgi:site-specific DNA-cytosine methylase